MTHSRLPTDLKQKIKALGKTLGFQALGISHVNLDTEHRRFHSWLENHYHGEMGYMARNQDKRLHPARMIPGTLSVICVRMDYLPELSKDCFAILDHDAKAYVSRYALGRDYHKLMRKRLQKLAMLLSDEIGEYGYRVFTDSAPVLEKALATRAGLGWQGKHSNVLHREHGSWFFLGEIYTDLELEPDQPISEHCGECTACMDKCPTQAIVAPYIVDSRRCISYLTIEHHSAIPEELREAMGNRIYGCDDCQLYCPWNRFEKLTQERDFLPRNELEDIDLLTCFNWTEPMFNDRLKGTAIRRIGYEKWRRNIAVALGNAVYSPHIVSALEQALDDASPLVAEHVHWALNQQLRKSKRKMT